MEKNAESTCNGEENKEVDLEFLSKSINQLAVSDNGGNELSPSKSDFHIVEGIETSVNNAVSTQEAGKDLSALSKKVQEPEKQEELLSIKSLEVGVKNWTIKAWVEQKSSIIKFQLETGSNTVFSVRLRDNADGKICVCFYGKFCDEFYPKIKEGAYYKISGGKVRPVSAAYHGNFHSCFILADSTTNFIESSEEQPLLLSKTSNTEHSEVSTINKLPLRSCFDCKLTVSEVKDLQLRVRFDNENVYFRDVILSDDKGDTVRLCLWEDAAKCFKHQKGDKIALQNVRLKSYNSKNYIEFSQKSVIADGIDSAENSKPTADKLKLAKLKDLAAEDGRGYVRGKIICHNPDVNLYYPACETCNKKLSKDTAEWKCGCGFSTQTPNYKFLIHLLLSDGETNGWVQVFEPAALKLMNGITANELNAENSLEKAVKKLKSLKMKTFLFQVKAKTTVFKEKKMNFLQVQKILDDVAE